MILRAVRGQPLFVGNTVSGDMKKVELLSPAGGYETMVGAFNAGADAVYLGGSKFGARAYADNFDRDQVLDAIVYAHLHGKRIYMTVNTLVKESEFGQLYDFMLPYAEKNLDGVIVQDFGVMRLIGREFPNIELHASTQQTVTGVYGARLLKDLGCCRVVPARELSLEEMKAIKTDADIEVEAFIHGAMCYCYSGACLFSSVIGGRSGNRGRCAQPCRLPYRMPGQEGKELYPLSLKDMSTIGIIPELIEAGIDSFKIEGRMKKPEYSAGVTALYRKYIDRYYQDPKGDYEVSREDMEILRSLYQRTGISEGYYHRHNDKTMVTLSSPAYNATSEDILKDVHERFLTSTLKLKCDIYCELRVGEKLRLAMTAYRDGEVFYAEEYGNPVQAASKRPMGKEDIIRQLAKLGGTAFEASDIDVVIDDGGTGSGIFVAVSELNELRRKLVAGLEKEILNASAKRSAEKVLPEDKGTLKNKAQFAEYGYYKHNSKGLHVSVNKKEQLKALLDELISIREREKTQHKMNVLQRIYVDSTVFLSLTGDKSHILEDIDHDDRALLTLIDKAFINNPDLQFFVSLPYISRSEEWDGIRELDRILEGMKSLTVPDAASGGKKNIFTGLLVRNLEQFGYLKDTGFNGRLVTDYGVYIWNKEALLEYLDCNSPEEGFMTGEMTVPYELSFGEAKELLKSVRNTVDIPVSYNVYGRLPMMISAGCIRKTTGKCSGKLHELHSERLSIVDRMNNVLPVTTNCRSCYNIIWNAHPTSLHKKLDRILAEKNIDSLRVDFTTENEEETIKILRYYTDRMNGKDTPDVFENMSYTGAHFNRGVE